MSWDEAVTVLVPHRSGNIEVQVAKDNDPADERPRLKARIVTYALEWYDHEPTQDDVANLARSFAARLP